MGLFNRSKNVYVDALEAAHEKVATALDVFNEAGDSLADAVSHFETVEADAQRAVEFAQARGAEAAEAKAKSQRILDRLDALTA